MKPIASTNYFVNFNADAYDKLNRYMEQENLSSIFILTDNNTYTYCLPILLSKITTKTTPKVIQITEGEKFKNLTTCNKVWQQLTQLGADRNSLLLNLGGGVVTDLGGFVASCFKRGISFINIPTTLLGMVDASVGGKTGVDFFNLKNQIGVFANPKMVLIDTVYLKTLEEREFRSGLAEIIKYGLTFDVKLWNYITNSKYLKNSNLNWIIYRSIEIKNDVVLKDPKENKLRKVLNFGHTFGHAIESYFLNSKTEKSLTHGESIAIGMITACYLSEKMFNFSHNKTLEIKAKILKLFSKVLIPSSAYKDIISHLKHDKKNTKGKINFVLLSNFEEFNLNCKVSEKLLIEALNFYNS